MINQLSSSDWIAILTLVITSIITIILYQRIRKKKIIFLQKNHLQLNNVDFSTIQDLEMIYKNENINKFLFYITGTIIILGDEDIEESDINHPICILIKSKNSTWKDCRIIDKTDLLTCLPEIDNGTLKFKTKDIKVNDFIKFESFYNSSKIGTKLSHRIHNVIHHIEVIDEKEIRYYKILAFLFSAIIIFLVSTILLDYYPADNKYIYIGRQKLEKPIERTEHSEIEPMTKKDSLFMKRHQYDDLYIIRGEKIKSDSIFIVNRKLNYRKNKLRIETETKRIDSIYKNKTSTYDKYRKDSEKYLIKNKNVLYYENDWSISDKRDSIIDALNSRNVNINKETVYKINDTISISFNKRSSYTESSSLFGLLFLIFRVSLILIFAVFVFNWLYKLHLYNKYKKIYNF